MLFFKQIWNCWFHKLYIFFSQKNSKLICDSCILRLTYFIFKRYTVSSQALEVKLNSSCVTCACVFCYFSVNYNCIQYINILAKFSFIDMYKKIQIFHSNLSVGLQSLENWTIAKFAIIGTVITHSRDIIRLNWKYPHILLRY